MATKKKHKKLKQKVVQNKAAAKSAESNNPLVKNSFFLLGGVLLIVFFMFKLPMNKAWVENRIVRYYKDISRQKQNLDVTHRIAERSGTNYQIASFACQNVPRDSWFLIPPQAYYLGKVYKGKTIDKIVETFGHVAMIKIFNYHCQDLNLVALHMDKEFIDKAQYTLLLTPNGGMQIVDLTNEQNRAFVMKEFDVPLTWYRNREQAFEYISTL